MLPFTLWENAVLGHQRDAPYGRGPWIDRAGARRRTAQIIDSFDVRTPGPEVPIFTLSGGNQQKLIVGREMHGRAVDADRLASRPAASTSAPRR